MLECACVCVSVGAESWKAALQRVRDGGVKERREGGEELVMWG